LSAPPARVRWSRLQSGFTCSAWERHYPIICGITGFRLVPDPYIGIAEDQAKGQLLFEAGKDRDFEQLLQHYYAIAKEYPPDLAVNWIALGLADVSVAEFILRQSRLGCTGLSRSRIAAGISGWLRSRGNHEGYRANFLGRSMFCGTSLTEAEASNVPRTVLHVGRIAHLFNGPGHLPQMQVRYLDVLCCFQRIGLRPPTAHKPIVD
jgi:hypothetical protein